MRLPLISCLYVFDERSYRFMVSDRGRLSIQDSIQVARIGLPSCIPSQINKLYDLMPIRERSDDGLPVRLWVDPDKVSQSLGSPQNATLRLAVASTKLECGVRCDPNVSRAHLHLSV